MYTEIEQRVGEERRHKKREIYLKQKSGQSISVEHENKYQYVHSRSE